MTNSNIAICKENILKCLTKDFKRNQAIFDKDEGYQIFNGTDLTMVMDAVIKGLEFSKDRTGYVSCTEELIAYIDTLEGESCNPFHMESILKKYL